MRSFSLAWAPGGEGFYYVRYDAPTDPDAPPVNPRIMRHVLGEPIARDELVYAPADPVDWLPAALRTTPDGAYLTFEGRHAATQANAFYLLDLAAPSPEVVELIPEDVAAFHYEANVGSELYLRTTLDAPKGRLIALDAMTGDLANVREILPETDQPLSWVSRLADRLVACRLDAARRRLSVHDLEGELLREIELPDAGGNPSGLSDRLDSREAFLSFSSIAEPGAVFALDLEAGEMTVAERPGALGWDPEAFVTRQVFFKSADGTRVPMFLSHRRDLELDGSNHVLMYGYGAWGWAAFPWFNPLRIVWLRSGGVFALPGLRGGGEYGAEWHDAGRGTNKENTLADMIAAAEWLIEEGYTNPRKLALQGGSASGLLPAALANRRPDLFRAALVNWPRLDMIRFVLYGGKTVNVPEYGTPEDPEQFAALLAYSPYHNVRAGASYPALFVTCGTEDRTTLPCHAYKYVAAVQTAQAGDAPILLRVDWGGGHYPRTTERSLAVQADQLAFLFHELGVDATAATGAR